MLYIIQFPFGDIRSFTNEESPRLNDPLWPCPKEGQYLRSAGRVERRLLGGLDNWIGETKICNAKRACRFKDGFRSIHVANKIFIRPVFRRIFFDGYVAGKFELGFSVESDEKGCVLGIAEFREVLKEIFQIPLRVPSQNGLLVETSLISAGRYFANFFNYASSPYSSIRNQPVDSQLVKACPPLLFIETRWDEKISNPYNVRRLPELEKFKLILSHFWLKSQSQSIRCWQLDNSTQYLTNARELRISLLRLNSCREGLNVVVDAISKNRISPKPYGNASQRLQNYINNVMPQGFEVPDLFKHSDILQVAYQSENTCLPGERHILIEKLKSEINIRRQILGKASNNFELREKLMEKEKHPIFQEVLIMGDVYDVKQAGIVGKGAHADNVNFLQIWQDQQNKLDLNSLTNELSKLRDAMKSEATTAEHDLEMGAIAKAEIEAKKNNGPKVLEALSNVGKWTLEIAEKIGVGLATAAIKTTLGL